MKKEKSTQLLQEPTELEKIRHSFAHLLAAAVKKLYPEVQLGIGPVIENGFYYDFGNLQVADEDLVRIEDEMRKIAKRNLAFSKEMWPAEKALEHFKKENQPFKIELVEDLTKPVALEGQSFRGGTVPPVANNEVGMVYTGDAFLDLCRGGHVENTSELPLDAFKLIRIAGAYWRGDENRPMLTRVYGVAFETKEELDTYLKQLEEAEKRDHKKLGKELGLFTFSELIGPGLPLYKPKGTFILKQLKEYSGSLRKKMGYQEVHTPQINKAELFKVSGHYDKYKDSMFRVTSNYTEEEYYLKPMNCPQHTQIFASEMRSYKEMPVRLADFANLYRDEKPGELGGLTRLRAFSQDDGHCFCREDQIEEEFTKILNAIAEAMKTYQLNYSIRLSLRDEAKKEQYLGDDKLWENAQNILTKILAHMSIDFTPMQGEAAFYGPKMDLIAKDSLGRGWQLSTIQLDFSMPKRFGLEYIDEKGNKATPVMIHSALIGSAERFLGVLIEHFAGAFPLWLAPEQVWVIPIGEKFNSYGQTVADDLVDRIPSLRIIVREENETLGKKIRSGQLQKIPYLIVVGEKEQSVRMVSARSFKDGDLGSFPIQDFADRLQKELLGL
ncbi:MAG: threonine--tRNA ligase [Candidatus Spechtbacteria bacterium]|nr:threonine--tRNA ligase [Candidatus Spechtbacteria bacterium]